jgi:hypothetical protein
MSRANAVQSVVDLVHRVERLRADLKAAEKALLVLVKLGRRPRGRPRKEYTFTVEQYRRALARGGSRRGAAKILGVPHANLDRWCARNGMQVLTAKVKR